MGTCFLIPESPKYLISVGKYEKASQSLRKICKINKVDRSVSEAELSEQFSSIKGDSGGEGANSEEFSRLLMGGDLDDEM